ncbi:MAG: BamA/TamA family outer membrane protein, partial [Rhodothermales bacterium]|nr:BamA/TamA family outer membrane protein [Rhodothermales bacterium]
MEPKSPYAGGGVWAVLAALVLGVAAAGPGARAQTPPAPDAATTPTAEPPRVAAVGFDGDLGRFDRATLAELVRTRRNRRFLGVPGLTPGLWLYRAGEGIGGAFGRALRRSGEPPSALDLTLVEGDRQRLEALYRQGGYRAAAVAAEVDTLAGGERARVTFRVAPGPLSTVRRVRYEGLVALDAEARRRLARQTVLDLAVPRRVDALAFDARTQPLAETELLEERTRLLALLRDEGYARVTRDSIRAVAFPVEGAADVYDVALRVRPGPRYAFGDVLFTVEGLEEGAVRTDTLAVGAGEVVVVRDGERAVRAGLLLRALQFEPGERYRRRALLATKRRLERTGVFAFSEITPLEPVPAAAAGDSLPRLPHRIALRTRPRHALQFNGFVLQRTGLLAPENTLAGDELGFGVGATYRNRNAFGGGETFGVRLGGSVAGDFGQFPTSQLEGAVSLTYPYLVPPFGALERALEPYDARTRLEVGALTARRDELRLLIRARASAGFRLEVQHTQALTSALDLLDFRLSDPDTLSGFGDRFLDLVDDPVARAFVLDDYTRPQVSNALRYTIRSQTANLFLRDRGHLREGAVEVGGNLPWLLDRLVFTPDTLEGSLPGLPFFEDAAGTNRLEYRQYVRAVADLRQYVPLSRLNTLAWKLIVGVAHPTGDAPVVPFDRRFYVGGANSVRGWRLRTLGPGGLRPDEAAFVQGGDVKLEGSAELRTVVLQELLAADWQLALFADAGNVWFGPRNPGDPDGRFELGGFYEEVALGAG